MSSKRQSILEYLRTTRLPTITTGNGYNNTVQTIERGLRFPDDISDPKFPAIFISRTEETRKNLTRIHFQSELAVSLVGFVKSTYGNSGAQIALDGLIEDVTKCLETDRLLGGLVNWTEIRSIKSDIGDIDPHAACGIDVYFIYTTEGVTP